MQENTRETQISSILRARPDRQSRQRVFSISRGKKVKFAALQANLSVDSLEDPSRLPSVRLNDCMDVDYLFDLGSDLMESHEAS